jgi:hypothetical protein
MNTSHSRRGLKVGFVKYNIPMICGGNRIADRRRAAYAFRQMNTTPKSIYLFLSSEKDFAAFCRILTKTRKPIEAIESIGVPVFSMLS